MLTVCRCRSVTLHIRIQANSRAWIHEPCRFVLSCVSKRLQFCSPMAASLSAFLSRLIGVAVGALPSVHDANRYALPFIRPSIRVDSSPINAMPCRMRWKRRASGASFWRRATTGRVTCKTPLPSFATVRVRLHALPAPVASCACVWCVCAQCSRARITRGGCRFCASWRTATAKRPRGSCARIPSRMSARRGRCEPVDRAAFVPNRP